MQMDASSLAVELAPVIMRQKGDSRADYFSHIYYTSKGPPTTVDLSSNYNPSDYLLGKLHPSVDRYNCLTHHIKIFNGLNAILFLDY